MPGRDIESGKSCNSWRRYYKHRAPAVLLSGKWLGNMRAIRRGSFSAEKGGSIHPHYPDCGVVGDIIFVPSGWSWRWSRPG